MDKCPEHDTIVTDLSALKRTQWVQIGMMSVIMALLTAGVIL